MKLGFVVSEITVTRYLPRRPTEPARVKPRRAFLRNHKDAIAAMDFFTGPTASLRILYVLFIIEHDRRCLVPFNVTPNPTSAWVIQPLREAFPYDAATFAHGQGRRIAPPRWTSSPLRVARGRLT